MILSEEVKTKKINPTMRGQIKLIIKTMVMKMENHNTSLSGNENGEPPQESLGPKEMKRLMTNHSVLLFGT